MRFDWEIKRLKEIGEIVTGKTPSGKIENAYGGEILFLTPRDLSNQKITFQTERTLSDDGLYDVAKYLLPKNAVSVSCIGSDLGKVTILGKESVTNQQINSIIVNDDVNHEYIYYELSLRQNELKSIAGGSATPIINKSTFSEIEIKLPPRNVQDQIVDQLAQLDQKIHLNQQTNETLEAMAQAIFKSWFVDFDPVRVKIAAKKAGRDPEKAAMAAIAGVSLEQDWDEIESALQHKLNRMASDQATQLRHTASLFSDEMVESDLGEVPKGWSDSKLEDYISLSYGKSLRKSDRKEGTVPVYGSGGLTGTHNKSLIEGPGIIVGRKGTVGSIYWEDRDFWPIDTVFYIEPKKEADLSFYYYLLNTLGLEEMNTDAAVPGLNRNNAYRLQMPHFPDKLVLKFSNFTADLHKMMRIKKEEKKSLERLRDTLLPKLISGELDVKQNLNLSEV